MKHMRDANAHVSLPDAILRETLHNIVHSQIEPNRKTVLENLKKFVEIVYFQGYSPDTLSCTLLTYEGYHQINQ